MEPIEATREIYRTIHKYKSETKYEDIERLVNYGAHLSNIPLTHNVPLCFAMANKCSPKIVRLFAEKGGVDHKFRTTYNRGFSIHVEDFQDDFGCVIYSNIWNTLFIMYHTCMRTNEEKNQLCEYFFNNGTFKKKFYFPPDTEPIINSKILQHIELIKEYCNIVNIYEDEIKNGKLEFPDDIFNLEQCNDDDESEYEWFYSDLEKEGYVFVDDEEWCRIQINEDEDFKQFLKEKGIVIE
jgi:hypothetical protein